MLVTTDSKVTIDGKFYAIEAKDKIGQYCYPGIVKLPVGNI